ncbi:MAG TPA: leucine zipper domain-containing protein, partial [Acidobacteriota bacterium]|nr:leucine zipper domain-containing protein [Acidobacteriota bacterium]
MYPHAARGYGALIPGSEYIRFLIRQGSLSKGAGRRLRWMDHYAEHGNARLTCRYSGISAPTFYRWKNRHDPYDLTTLEEESRRPHKVPQSRTPGAVESRVLELRGRYPRWGREKLAV